MKKFKCRLSNIHCETLIRIIEFLIKNLKPSGLNELLLVSALGEVMLKMKTQTISYNKEYKFSFTPTQAFAITVLFIDYIKPQKKDFGNDFINKLHQLKNEIIKAYMI